MRTSLGIHAPAPLGRALLLTCLALAALASARSAHADRGAATDKTLSPYFVVEGGDPARDGLPLERTRVHFHISGVIADVTVTQTYKNAGARPLSARYVFPASTRAAVHGMRMTVGAHVIEAKIEERERAQAAYEAAKQVGKTASLLDQQRPNVFTMQVANVMPGDRIEVELRYTEILIPAEGVYEFVYPTVVGPRYTGPQGAAGAGAWAAQPTLRERDAPTYAFELSGQIATGVPIMELDVSSHRVRTEQQAPSRIELTLDASERAGGDRDFILRYRLSGSQVQAGLLLHEGDGEHHFLLTVQPPLRVAKEAMPPREYVFVLDVSGSMHGFPLDTAKTVLRELSRELRPEDSFNVLSFSGGADVLWPRSRPATAEHVAQALSLIDKQQGGGSTELLGALQQAFALPAAQSTSRTFVVITDGYILAERDVFDWIRGHLDRANVFSFGIGTSVNRYLLDGIACAGLGESFVVTDPAEAKAAAARFRRYIAAPVLTRVTVETEGFDAYELEPRAIPDLFAERPLVVFGKWRGRPGGTIKVRGRSAQGDYEQVIDVSGVRPDPGNAALARLWARARIAQVSDYGAGQETAEERALVTALGLRYNLLTQFTSFVAVSHVVRNASGQSDDVTQPVPLPLGVSELAVGEPMYGSPEPELGLLLMAAGLLLFSLARVHTARRAGVR
jgi:Ca-activated chloride channel homolog